MDNLEPYPDFYKIYEYGDSEKNLHYATVSMLNNLICNNNVNLVK